MASPPPRFLAPTGDATPTASPPSDLAPTASPPRDRHLRSSSQIATAERRGRSPRDYSRAHLGGRTSDPAAEEQVIQGGRGDQNEAAKSYSKQGANKQSAPIQVPHDHKQDDTHVAASRECKAKKSKEKEDVNTVSGTKRVGKISVEKKRTEFNQLSDEVIIHILKRLPEIVGTYRLVSKDWYTWCTTVMRETGFRLTGLFIRSKSQMGTCIPITKKRGKAITEFDTQLQKLPGFDKLSMVDSCNGMMLFGNHQNIYAVWNYVKKMQEQLPELPPALGKIYCFLGYDPEISPDYKVCRFNISESSSSIIIHQYSSENGIWNRSTESNVRGLTGKGCYKRATIYQQYLFMLPIEPDCDILQYDMEKKKISYLSLPSARPNLSKFPNEVLGVISGKMYYASHSDTYKLTIYVLADLKSSNWSLVHNMQHPGDYKLLLFNPSSETLYLKIGDLIDAYDFGIVRRRRRVMKIELFCNWQNIYPITQNIYPTTAALEPIDPPRSP